MNLADRVKDTSTSTGTGNFTLSGTAPTGFQSLSAIGAVGATFGYVIDGGAEWETGTGTITATNTFSRAPSSSSNAGALVNFSAGTKTVFHGVTAAQYAKFQSTNTASFATAIPLTSPGVTYMPQQTVSAVLAFTVGASPVQGALVYLRLVADGTNAPTFAGLKEWGGSLGYDNRAGIVNEVQFFHDGYDYWYSISQAVGAVAIAPAASAVTLARSAASGVVSTGVTITVGTNNPLTGSQTESVALSSDIAGTWSVNPVALSAGTATATSVFTPSATGSATITGTATGTPTLTNGTVGYTVNASATVPATMSAPVATAGDTTANIVFTVPSDGGSTITGYTLTPYIGATAQAAQTFGAVASPITATGLANSSAYTFKMHANNAVGAGTDSPASNSVTPAAASAAQARLTAKLLVTESGTGPWTYAGNANQSDLGGTLGGLMADSSLALLLLGSSSVFQTTATVLGDSAMIGFVAAGTSAVVGFTSMPYAIFNVPAGYQVYASGTQGTVNGAATVAAVGDIMRLTRSGTTIVFDVSKNSGTSWTTVHTWTGTPTSNYRLEVIPRNTAAITNMLTTGAVVG